MAPIKFEDNIRARLEHREIKPSAEAWQKLEASLDQEAKPAKSKKSYGWVLIAASFIGILILAGRYVFQDEMDKNPVNQVVETPTEMQNEQKSEPTETLEQKQQDILAQEETSVAVQEEQQIAEPPKKRKEKPVIQKYAEAVAVTDSQKASADEKLDQTTQSKIDAEVNDLISKVQEQQNSGVAYSDAEIDQLLRDAQRDIISEKMFDRERNTISAEALLYEVEEELDPSFRDRIFEALKEGFMKAREAIVSRNN
ncbi:MAG: hypothetical protein VX253_10815 [Bacteroidota bacterium]|nr:hypothetical protein [Bacteroidota bacterium]